MDRSSGSSPYQPIDPIISSNFSPLSASASRPRPTSSAGFRSPNPGPSMLASSHERGSESDPLLGSITPIKKPFYRPRPMWLVPFAIVASTVRGMTLAPRVQVFTQLSCNAIFGHDVYDHTNLRPVPSYRQSLSPDSILPNIPHTSPPGKDVLGDIPSYIYEPLKFPSIPMTSLHDPVDSEPDPRAVPSKRCLSDPRVQAGAAKIQTIMTTAMGTLSALTTGWWGHFGERHGRTRVLAISTLGLFLTDLTFILVSTPHSVFAAHGHKLLVISPFIEGLLGGWSTLQGATSAYVSDCTSDGSRAHIFSRFAGVFYLGFSVGPAVGAYLIRHPILSGHTGASVHNGSPTVTSVFYVAALCSFVNLLLVLFVFPESLDKKAGIKNTHGVRLVEGDELRQEQGLLARFFGPLKLFLPKKVEFPEGGYHRDWSLTFLALALFGYLLSTGIFQIKYLYAEHIYGWGAEQLSYYISFVGALRALHLLVFMPALIGTFKPKPKPKSIAHSSTPSNSLVTRSAPLHVPPPPKKLKPTPQHLAKEMTFDLLVLRLSLIIDLCSHSLVSILPPTASQGLFVGFSSLSSIGAGVIPTLNSFALCAMQMRSFGPNNVEDGGVGRLFGALAIIQAVGQQIIGPMMFGMIYSSTVAKFPQAIFTTAAGVLLVSILFLCFLRPDASLKARKQQRKSARHREELEVERGRSRISKDLGTSRQYVYAIQASSSSGASSSTFA